MSPWLEESEKGTGWFEGEGCDIVTFNRLCGRGDWLRQEAVVPALL